MTITATVTNIHGKRVSSDIAWSYSKLRNFEICARRYNEIDNLKKFREGKSPALEKGFLIHAAMAKRISQGAILPPDMPYEEWIEYVFKGDGLPKAEKKMAITKDFEPCEYFDKIKTVWYRAVADVIRIDGRHAHIVDWKTGKVKPDLDQLVLTSLCAMIHYPQILSITADLVWLEYNTKTTIECTTDDLVEAWQTDFRMRVDLLQAAHRNNEFPPNPSGLCRKYCPVTSCEHCGH